MGQTNPISGLGTQLTWHSTSAWHSWYGPWYNTWYGPWYSTWYGTWYQPSQGSSYPRTWRREKYSVVMSCVGEGTGGGRNSRATWHLQFAILG
jgi:hypothetical protein